MIESKSIPYVATALRGERLLVLAPHPDDEVIGCGGLVAQHLREGRQVRIVVATDGGGAGDAKLREEESRRAVATLGNADLHFLGIPDRELDQGAGEAVARHLHEFRPDLILVPSPIEIHPDHLALAQIVSSIMQRDDLLFAELGSARLAFFEVGQPIRPNTLVDISDVADAKYAAVAAHTSQTSIRDYVGYARGLNAYRAMTLPPDTKFAEAYYVLDLRELHTKAFSELRDAVGAPPAIEVTRETLPVSVVVRTKDRPRLLHEAIASIRATGYPCEIVVVNDGGAKPSIEGVTLVNHESSRGRSEAANAGARAATKAFLSFLDDDDVFHPEHLDVLTAAAHSTHSAWYTDATSVFLRPAADGTYEPYSRLRLYAHDYDRELLLLDNYIPLPTLLFRREDFLALGGFDPAFDLFEDWDFLIRLSARGDMLRIPRITCDIRHFEGGSSVVLATPEGSEQFRDAKKQIWTKHASRIDNDLVARVLERQKRRMTDLYSRAAEASGQKQQYEIAAEREQRERVEMQNTINGYMLHVRELQGEVQSLQTLVPQLTGNLTERTLEVERLGRALADTQQAHGSATAEIAGLHAEIARLRVEIDRLNGLLEMIYRSKTWKLHATVEKLRGRG